MACPVETVGPHCRRYTENTEKKKLRPFIVSEPVKKNKMYFYRFFFACPACIWSKATEFSQNFHFRLKELFAFLPYIYYNKSIKGAAAGADARARRTPPRCERGLQREKSV